MVPAVARVRASSAALRADAVRRVPARSAVRPLRARPAFDQSRVRLDRLQLGHGFVERRFGECKRAAAAARRPEFDRTRFEPSRTGPRLPTPAADSNSTYRVCRMRRECSGRHRPDARDRPNICSKNSRVAPSGPRPESRRAVCRQVCAADCVRARGGTRVRPCRSPARRRSAVRACCAGNRAAFAASSRTAAPTRPCGSSTCRPRSAPRSRGNPRRPTGIAASRR